MFKKKNKKNNERLHRVYVELDSHQKVSDFTSICNSIPDKVVLKGKDENGADWETNAKSLLFNLAIAGILNDKERLDKAANIGKVDWNSVYVESEADIYSALKDFAK